MKTNDLRRAYLEFFRGKGHTICPSDVLVPTWDPTVLFTPAGMNQFKDHFLGKVQLKFTRAASCQKCLRTGDIENVGRTPYHHTFFEMLGNFSFGDYFKREAIAWAWEFLTDPNWLALSPDQLTVTVYLDDDEAAEIWRNDIGLPASRISRRDEYENFWPAAAPSQGPDGVCGPCSEIYFHPGSGKEVEIWNLVFTQFNRMGDPPQNLHPLPSKNIDTGMGLERTAATLQGVESNYEIDILKPIVLAAAETCGRAYEFNSDSGRRLRRITDHVRACTFAIHENVYPGPNKENYVVKRLLRRAVLDGRQLGMREPFLYKLVPAVVEMMSEPYPEIRETAARVSAAIEKEESNFFATIDAGMHRMEEIFQTMRRDHQSTIDGRLAAELYQTFGVPAELFESIGAEQHLQFDWDGYRQEMERHSVDSGKLTDSVMGSFGPLDELKNEVKASTFVGYDRMRAQAKVQGIIAADQRWAKRRVEDEPAAPGSDEVLTLVVLDQTPFYAESGGQVGDVGTLRGPRGRFEVRDTQRESDLILHYGRVVEGELCEGDTVDAEVDEKRRAGIRRAHSATHLLHYALRKHLGSHAQQRGSKVDDDWLRFDFTNLEAVAAPLVQTIEQETLAKIEQHSPVQAEILPLGEARQRGAMMLFGEKYPDPVRMISMGDYSRELCGGTHATNTGDIREFEILSEEGVSAGTRRIVALTGDRAVQHAKQVRDAISQAATLLRTTEEQINSAIAQLLHRVRSLRKQLAGGSAAPTGPGSGAAHGSTNSLKTYADYRDALKTAARALNAGLLDVPKRIEGLLAEERDLMRQLSERPTSSLIRGADLMHAALKIGSAHVVVSEVPNTQPQALRLLIDEIRGQVKPSAVFLASIGGADKIHLVAGLSRDLVDQGLSAGEWVKHVAPVVGGGGGGKPDVAQAGGKHPENIKQALQAATDYMRSALAT